MNPGPDPGAGAVVRVAQTHPACRVLGPGSRYTVWVQGCPLRCPGCTSPGWIPFAGGRIWSVDQLAAEIIPVAEDGLTLSGGEPFAQADALAELVAVIRQHRDLSVMAYTGYTLGELRRDGSPAQTRLLGSLDLLVDGPYRRELHADLLWRGSSNQRIHRISDRYPHLGRADTTGAGLQFEIDPGGRLRWCGVPATPGFRRALEQRLGLVAARDDDDEELSI